MSIREKESDDNLWKELWKDVGSCSLVILLPVEIRLVEIITREELEDDEKGQYDQKREV